MADPRRRNSLGVYEAHLMTELASHAFYQSLHRKAHTVKAAFTDKPIRLDREE